MQLHIRHETVYRYDAPVKHSVQNLRLTPRPEAGQRVLSWTISAPGRQVQQVDAHGNVMHMLTLDQPHDEIRIVVSGVVETAASTTPVLSEEGCLSPMIYLAETPLTHADTAIRGFAVDHGSLAPTREDVVRLANAVRDALDYTPGATSVADTASHAFSLGNGVCQDHAHVMIAACRSLRVPARYVSGYVLTDDRGHVASHAWVDVWIEGEKGWFGYDVTNREPAGERHCRLAVGRDYLDACPVRGVRRGGGAETMHALVLVSDTAEAHQGTARMQRMQSQQ